MRVLVVGGTGFLGARVVARLSNLGHEAAVYHRGVTEPALPFGVRHVHSDDAAAPVVSFPRELTGIAWDVVLAASPAGGEDAGAVMAAFRGVARRVVALSPGDSHRAPEVERTVMSDSELPGTFLRLPAMYGPGDARHRLRPFWRRIERGMPVVIGREQAAFRWTHGYVEDVAQAVVLSVCRERARGRVYDVGEADTPTMAQRIEAFGRAIGWKGSVVAIDDSALPAHLAVSPGAFREHLVFDTSRIRAELDWRETVAADEAFRRTAAWEASCGSVAGERVPSEEEYAREAGAAQAEAAKTHAAEKALLPFPDSLCHACAAPPKYVRTSRSTFIFCPLFRRYPPQPVFECPKFLPREV